MAFQSPVYHVIPVPIEKIVPNTYNPNAVAPPEMKLLYDSIKEDGYTMPIVCYYVKEKDIYVIVDGFHRYRVMLDYPDIRERERGMLPVSVINKSLDNRMASTIRHNRARGSHDVDLMSNIVKELHELGRSDAWISKHLGMDKDEILRLKQITGLAALFKDVKFGQAWKPVVDEFYKAEQEAACAEISEEEKRMVALAQFEFRTIRPDEVEQAIEIEQICFPPHEACSPNSMRERIAKAPELFLVAADKETGKLAGFLNGLSTKESVFRDEFFTDANLYDPEGENVMLLGLDVLPEYRGQGLARELVAQYRKRELMNNRKCLILTCLADKVEMYQKMGFQDKGISASSWGGEEWHEMITSLD